MKKIIKVGRLFDGKQEKTDQLIFLQDDIIEKIVSWQEVNQLKGEIIDLSSYTVLPGLIDCHVHLFMEGIFDMPERGKRWKESYEITLLRAVKNLQQTIKCGVTTIRDLGCPKNIALTLKKALNQGVLQGPRIMAAGQAISITGGHFYYGGNREADGEQEMVKAVREQAKAGADLIKVMMTGCVNFVQQNSGIVELTEEEIKAVVGEAHRLGKKVAVHVNGKAGVKQVLTAGVDTIEHCTFLDDETIEAIAESDVYWIPTLMPFQAMLEYGKQYNYSYFPPEKVEKIYSLHRKMLSKAVKLGSKIAVGTDAGALGVEHGDIVGELRLLVENKILTPQEAIMAATVKAAEALGWEKKIGTIEPGKKADIIGVEGNPLQNINCLSRVVAVWKEGQLVYSTI